MIIGLHSVIVFYEFFYRKKYDSPRYKFKPPTKAIQKIQSFLKDLDHKYDLNTLGKTFLSNYFMFQFNRTHNQIFNRFASKHEGGQIKVGGRIQIYDIIGKQALKYWNERDIKFDFILQNCEFAKEHKVSLVEVRSLLKVVETKRNAILQSEEIEKSRYINSQRGLVNCILNTSLYNHRSQNCILCLYKKDCKKLLESNYNHIYQDRGYGKTA